MNWTVLNSHQWNNLGRPSAVKILKMKNDGDDKENADNSLFLFKSDQIQQLQEIRNEIEKLETENQDIKSRLDIDDIEYALKEHIRKMHEYNDVKDNVQLLLGKLAEFKGCTIKEMYKEYDLDFND